MKKNLQAIWSFVGLQKGVHIFQPSFWWGLINIQDLLNYEENSMCTMEVDKLTRKQVTCRRTIHPALWRHLMHQKGV